MGVFICLGQEIHEVKVYEAINYNIFGSFTKIQEKLNEDKKLFIFLNKGIHKIKKKAEQIACEEALKLIKENN